MAAQFVWAINNEWRLASVSILFYEKKMIEIDVQKTHLCHLVSNFGSGHLENVIIRHIKAGLLGLLFRNF
jgi:hypothetical protein